MFFEETPRNVSAVQCVLKIKMNGMLLDVTAAVEFLKTSKML